MRKHTLGIIAVVMMVGTVMGTCALAAEDIPPELSRWRSWVLHGHEASLCPRHYNDGAMARCQWPSRLDIAVLDNGGRFEQHWQIFAPGWVALPGEAALWPEGVVVDGRSVAVIDRGHIPSVYLEPGSHLIKGRFNWSRTPEMIHIPPALGLLALTVEGQKITAPVIDDKGRLWLREHAKSGGREDDLKVKVFRLINDTIPMQVTTMVRLDVSGQAREIDLHDILLPGAVPMQLDSHLPARLDPKGRLLIQARPGRWQVHITTRMPERIQKISIAKVPFGDEIWSFQPQHHLRIVELSGVPQVEPGQTEIPDSWRRFPAYSIMDHSTLMLKEIRRGDPEPAPDQLTLHRRWWLDFDGGGFTVHDNIQGTLSRQWFLAVSPPMELGRVAIDGKDQIITAHGEARQAGVELRKGELKLQADARLSERTLSVTAVGWDHDFQKVTGQLHLPPGWRLLAAQGVDQISHTWLQQWSLLDFFLVLIIALAISKLRHWRWGLLALGTMILIFHEPGAPRLVWLNIVAVLALMPLLPDGWLKRLVSLWGVAAGVVLLTAAIPFVADQIRWGFYPQLAPHNDDVGRTGRDMADVAALYEVREEDRQPSEAPSRQLQKGKVSPMAPMPLGSPPPQVSVKGSGQEPSITSVWLSDPDALIPTGPGLPDWHWQTVILRWNGPVAKDQTMRLYFLSPLANLALALLRVGLLVWLIWGLFDWRRWVQTMRRRFDGKAVAAGAAMMVIMGYSGVGVSADQGTFPPESLLDGLRERLLAPPDCLPHCADISRLELAISDGELQLMLKVHAADTTAVPMPVNRKSWAPSQIMLDNAPISGLARDESGTLWAMIPPGLHTVILQGSVAQEGMMSIPLPLKPHQAAFVAKGWSVKGILPDGRVGSSIQLSRLQTKDRVSTATDETGTLKPFLEVERVLSLGLTWQVHTTIRRMTPAGSPVVVSVPLLNAESVTTAGLHVDQGKVLINMAAGQHRLTYSSTLAIQSQIMLKAPRSVPWTEKWILDVSPVWHCEFSGIAPVHHQDGMGQWQPHWQPWPGESVTIGIGRPQAVEGRVVTIHQTHLTLTPGQRFSAGQLTMTINTSRGGQHTVGLPMNANLQKVRVNGKSLPIRQDGQWVSVPLKPGRQTVSVQWHQLSPFGMFYKAPALKIGEKAVNAKVTFQLPERWILFAGGPNWGPAVLFWSYLAVVVLAALLLGHIGITPLKSWQWLLLGLGLTQIPAVSALLIVGWLVALGMRERLSVPAHWFRFNSLQLGLVIWSLTALAALFTAVQAGLIGQPEMQIAGNNSGGGALHWTQDRIDTIMPQPWVFSLPIWVYRGLMLAWSLWLAFSLLRWLQWGWQCFIKDGAWKKMPRRRKKASKTEKV